MKEKSQRIFKEGERIKLVKEGDLKKLGYEKKKMKRMTTIIIRKN